MLQDTVLPDTMSLSNFVQNCRLPMILCCVSLSSLGSTRFFKVARARHKEGLAVVKVFVIHDPSLPLKTYRDQLQGWIIIIIFIC